ncbi:host attachment protein [Pseudaminobacter sp. 19-2017]|uniref:Host attachment protein n=1 Tax=Pseudaminobacter soli (ex Zhang et al. 2022) TaxID=2831468 RepID=A0A942E606_9HYPH|nr:host attachment protein [Pseudaminobacter soli]MBS3651596.1 host attachment protein [Pseudaminobacter soli]
MILPNETTVAVVDGTRLRLFRNRGREPQIDLVELPAPELDVQNQGSGGRHRAVAANPDYSRIVEDNFAAAAAGHLNRMALDGTVGMLMVVADPRTLGELRRHYHKALEAKILGDLAKDVAGEPIESIEEALRAA